MERLPFEDAMDRNQDKARRPEIIVTGGPNGAGKTTTAARTLPEVLAEKRAQNLPQKEYDFLKPAALIRPNYKPTDPEP